MESRLTLTLISREESSCIYGGTDKGMEDLAESLGKALGVISKLIYRIIQAIMGKGEKNVTPSGSF